MRDYILQCLGKFPQKVPLNLKFIEKEDYKDYELQLIEYNVEENEKVQSYLLIPKNNLKKNPAILAIHQHAGNWDIGKSEVVGKTNNPMYSYGLDLVKRGYVVIAPDIIGFESRKGPQEYNADKEGQKAWERFLFCDYLIHGKTLQGKTLHDLSVAIDVLCSLSFVDSSKIGVIGHSLGGQESIWLEWYDERIQCGVSSCGASQIESIIKHKILHNFYLYIPNLLEKCDIDEIIKEITEKRKLLIFSGSQDEKHFPLVGIKKIEEKANHENFISILFDDGHVFNDSEKEKAYIFLDENLK